MPVIYTQFDPLDIEAELRKRRYGFHGNRLAAIHLTVADPKNRFKMNGQAKRVLLRPVNFDEYAEITRKCSTVQEACDQIEAIATGAQLAADTTDKKTLSAETAERMIQNRVQNELAHVTQPLADELSKTQQLVEEQRALIELLKQDVVNNALKPEKRKPGRPKGSKTNRKVEVASDADLMRDGDLPPLSAEQQKMLAQVQMERG